MLYNQKSTSDRCQTNISKLKLKKKNNRQIQVPTANMVKVSDTQQKTCAKENVYQVFVFAIEFTMKQDSSKWLKEVSRSVICGKLKYRILSSPFSSLTGIS